MTRDQSEQIETLFAIWWEQQNSWRMRLGAPTSAIYSRHAQSTDIYTDGDDIDARIDKETANAVEKIMRDTLSFAQYNAIEIHARNRVNKISVFRSGRVKPEEAHAVYIEAKEALCPHLIRGGLVKRVEHEQNRWK